MVESFKDQREDAQIVSLENLVPKNHLLRKIEKVIDFNKVYDMVEHLYSADKGRPAVDPVVLVKMVFIQHLFGIPSLRKTVQEIEMNMAYRWFLGFNLLTPVPHFATISYAFSKRFPPEVFEQIFSWILEEAIRRHYIDPKTVFIDATQIKANANKNKKRKIIAQKVARCYEEQLREEINKDRQAHGKKPLKEKPEHIVERELVVSSVDPESGLFHKGEHKVEFAYTSHVACDKRNFILGFDVTPGNVHDSLVFDRVYDEVTARFPEVETVAIDAGYKTPWICKKIIDDQRNPSTPYKRPMTKKGFFRKYEYVYDEYYDCVICPNDQILKYRTTNRDGYREYASNPNICKTCKLLSQCTESKSHQKMVFRHVWEEYVEKAEDFRHSLKGKESYSLRSQTIERVFADAKEKFSMRFTYYKGLSRVKNWIRLKFAAMNLKKIANWAY